MIACVDRVLLFDIDGTMLSSGGSGQLAMEYVLLNDFGVPEIKSEIPSAGRTDRAIITDLFRDHEVEVNDHNFARFQHAYLSILPDYISKKTDCVLQGVVDLLERLASMPRVKLGLLTGNFRAGAKIKLSNYNLEHYFEFGGFGDHHHHRDDVAREAYRAMEMKCKQPVSPEDIWVIGDTPADITCARAIGAKVLAVSTGVYEADTLAHHQPDKLLHNLGDLEVVTSILLS